MISVATDGSAGHVRWLLDELDPRRVTVDSFEVRGATLDDVFLALTGHPSQRPRATGPHNTSRNETEAIGI